MMRLIYFFYYLKVLDWDKLRLFQKYVLETQNISFLNQWLKIIYNSIRYNISILEFYQFHFYELNSNDKEKWAGTGLMYEYQKIMNPPSKRDILDDKRKFFLAYKDYFKHRVYSLNDLVNDEENINQLETFEKLVFKISDGKCGQGIVFKNTDEFKDTSIVEFMQKGGFDLVETFIVQHPQLNKLSPSGVNTVRIFTQLNAENEVEILGCRQRISINCQVDNMAAGNIAAPINELTGCLDGPGVYSDITKSPETVHPETGVEIIGFQVPYWNECLELAKNAALKHPQNKSIGWDIVITESGPGLIEGNHDWCKLVWQLPVRKGLKHLLKSNYVQNFF